MCPVKLNNQKNEKEFVLQGTNLGGNPLIEPVFTFLVPTHRLPGSRQTSDHQASGGSPHSSESCPVAWSAPSSTPIEVSSKLLYFSMAIVFLAFGSLATQRKCMLSSLGNSVSHPQIYNLISLIHLHNACRLVWYLFSFILCFVARFLLIKINLASQETSLSGYYSFS